MPNLFIAYFSHTGNIPRKVKRQLGRTRYIRLGLIPIPAGFFLEITAKGSAEISVS